MGHAGAIVSGSSGTAQAKKEALEAAGVKVGKTPSETAELMRGIMQSLRRLTYPSPPDLPTSSPLVADAPRRCRRQTSRRGEAAGREDGLRRRPGVARTPPALLAHTGRDDRHRPPPRRPARVLPTPATRLTAGTAPNTSRLTRGPGAHGAAARSRGSSPGSRPSSLVLVPTVIAWLVEPLATGTAWDAVGTGAALWLLTAGAHLMAGQVTISLVPLLGPGTARRRRPARSARGHGRRLDRRRALARSPTPVPRGGPGRVVGRRMPSSSRPPSRSPPRGPFRVVVLSLLVPAVLVPVCRDGLGSSRRRARRPGGRGSSARSRPGPRRGPARLRPDSGGPPRCSGSGWSSSWLSSPWPGARCRRSRSRSVPRHSAGWSSSPPRSWPCPTSHCGPCPSSPARVSRSSTAAA